MNKLTISIFVFHLLVVILFNCSCKSSDHAPTQDAVTISVKSADFLSGGLAEAISVESRTMSDGLKADCYKIVVKGIPTDHSMGPWCPSLISDDASAGGIWLENGQVFDVDGAFVKNLGTFYHDNTWMMYNSSTGSITKTTTLQECEEAANPNVGAQYKNYCVECLPSYVASLTHTYYLPVTPKVARSSYKFPTGPGGPMSTGPSSRGLAFNGVVFDAPAPTDRILGAYTLAPFDDAGGHINLAAGYHYHAATGLSTKIIQSDGHSAMVGYAFDGYGIYENKDANGNEYTDLDELRGHYDLKRGYHYHIDKAGNNNFINGLRGVYVQ